jgi:hypothetical protein
MPERYRTPIEIKIDEMIAVGRSENEIRTAIRALYEPYNKLQRFDEGFADCQARRQLKEYGNDDGQAYDYGANAATWFSYAQDRMKRKSDLRNFSPGIATGASCGPTWMPLESAVTLGHSYLQGGLPPPSFLFGGDTHGTHL